MPDSWQLVRLGTTLRDTTNVLSRLREIGQVVFKSHGGQVGGWWLDHGMSPNDAVPRQNQAAVARLDNGRPLAFRAMVSCIAYLVNQFSRDNTREKSSDTLIRFSEVCEAGVTLREQRSCLRPKLLDLCSLLYAQMDCTLVHRILLRAAFHVNLPVVCSELSYHLVSLPRYIYDPSHRDVLDEIKPCPIVSAEKKTQAAHPDGMIRL